MKVSVTTYKRAFKILLFVFLGALAVQYISTALGYPFSKVTLAGVDMTSAKWVWFYQPFILAFFIDGIVNFFLTVKVIKEACRVDRLPALVVVILTLNFVLGILLAELLLIPNMIIFGIKRRLKNRYYEVDFRN